MNGPIIMIMEIYGIYPYTRSCVYTVDLCLNIIYRPITLPFIKSCLLDLYNLDSPGFPNITTKPRVDLGCVEDTHRLYNRVRVEGDVR